MMIRVLGADAKASTYGFVKRINCHRNSASFRDDTNHVRTPGNSETCTLEALQGFHVSLGAIYHREVVPK